MLLLLGCGPRGFYPFCCHSECKFDALNLQSWALSAHRFPDLKSTILSTLVALSAAFQRVGPANLSSLREFANSEIATWRLAEFSSISRGVTRVGRHIRQMLNHSCSRLVARQTGLAQDLQGVIGLRKIRVVRS